MLGVLRELFPDSTLTQRAELMRDLPLEKEDMYLEDDNVKQLLGAHCEYTYSRVPLASWGDHDCRPPWDTPEYIEAENWYKTLPEDDRKKIDILVKGNVPWG